MVKIHSNPNNPLYSNANIQTENTAPKPVQLRPYPIDDKQDKVVESVNRLARGVFRFSEAVSSVLAICFYPIKCIISYFSNLVKAKKPQEPTEGIPLSLDGTQKIAMDNKFYYTVSDGKILYKPIAATAEAPWKPFGNNEGYTDAEHTPLIAVRADGDNVVAVDKDNHIHYAKSYAVDVQVAFDGPEWQATTTSKVTWTTKWFSMDLVAPVVNRFKDPTLILRDMIGSCV